MNDSMQNVMAEATHLTRTGQLAKATEMIQRTLGIASASTMSTAGPVSADAPIDAEFHVVDDSPPSTKTSVAGMIPRSGVATRSTRPRPATASDVFSSAALHLPGTMRPATGGMRPVRPGVVSSSTRAGGQRRIHLMLWQDVAA